MRRIYLSDLHLEDPTHDTFLRFRECLELEARRNDEVYLLGDIVEMWVGDDDDSAIAKALVATLQAASQHCGVFVMHGNRDFLFADAFAEAAGVTLLEDPHMTIDGILLTHGDRYCTDDVAYQNMRTLFRSDEWQQEILGKSLTERQALGQMLRAQSKNSNANKATNIMDVNAGMVMAEFQTHGAKIMLHGHTHRPGLHHHADNQRWVLGAWENVGWICRQDHQTLQLEAFSLARHYEI